MVPVSYIFLVDILQCKYKNVQVDVQHWTILNAQSDLYSTVDPWTSGYAYAQSFLINFDFWVEALCLYILVWKVVWLTEMLNLIDNICSYR